MSRKEYFRIKTGFCNYKAMVEHMNKYMDRVHIGNKKKCIVISVYFDDIDNNPNIDAIGYHEDCNETGHLLKNTGTVHMIKSSMSFIVKHYNKYKFNKFQLKDKSTIKCQSGWWMPLNVYYLAKHGKTWYEMKLGAKPLRDTVVYRKDKTNLKKDMNLIHNSTKIELYEELMKDVSKPQKDALYKFFEKSKTMKEFLHYFFDSHDCYVFRNWLERYVKRFIPYIIGMEWVIEHDPFFNVEIEILTDRPTDLFMIGGFIQAGYFLL